MAIISSFNILGDTQARVLILGSMPSVQSLTKQQYYAHPRNAFWKIMAALFNDYTPLGYGQGQQVLQARGVVIWDVLKSCQRQGSLDSAIEKDSMQMNDFNVFFAEHPSVIQVYFNGGTAESLYKKHIWPVLAEQYKSLAYTRLPSTSPAYAAMSYQKKLAAWTVLQKVINQ
ncbi:MAG: double-stranded uracil-DNA glycosylase [Methyloprofundus sp.]|nr:MAG: double-stranded uracil-DNA glycosylase [Methyloprofundus sp.]